MRNRWLGWMLVAATAVGGYACSSSDDSSPAANADAGADATAVDATGDALDTIPTYDGSDIPEAGRASDPAGLRDTAFGVGGYRDTGVASSRIRGAVGLLDGILLFAEGLGDASTQRRVVRFDYDGNPDVAFNTVAAQTLATPPFAASSSTDESHDVDGEGHVYFVHNVAAPTTGAVAELRRLATDGSLDMSFGTGGVVTIASTAPLAAGVDGYTIEAIHLLADGSMILVGNHRTSSNESTPHEWTLIKLTSTGALDTTFHGTGWTSLGSTSSGSVVQRGLYVAADGTLYVLRAESDGGGTALAKTSALGTLDTTFGTGGVVILAANRRSFTAVRADTDGRVVLSGIINHAGDSGASGYATRLTNAGVVDSAFGKNGEVVVDFADTARPTLPWKAAFSSIFFDSSSGVTFGGNTFAEGASADGGIVDSGVETIDAGDAGLPRGAPLGYFALWRVDDNGAADPAFPFSSQAAHLDAVSFGVYDTNAGSDDGHDTAVLVTPDNKTIVGISGVAGPNGTFRFCHFN